MNKFQNDTGWSKNVGYLMIFFTTSKILTYDVGGYHKWVATSLNDSRGNFASIKQLSHQGSVVEPELFDEFARTQKIPVDF